jgi:hypothetical protein
VRVPWKLIGAAGLAGVAASGVVIARRRRAQQDLEPDELRRRLHERLAQVRAGDAGDPSAGRRFRPTAEGPIEG